MPSAKALSLERGPLARPAGLPMHIGEIKKGERLLLQQGPGKEIEAAAFDESVPEIRVGYIREQEHTRFGGHAFADAQPLPPAQSRQIRIANDDRYSDVAQDLQCARPVVHFIQNPTCLRQQLAKVVIVVLTRACEQN